MDSNNNPVFWNFFFGGVVDSKSSLDIDNFMLFHGSVSKIHVFLDLDRYSSSTRIINRIDSCTGQRDEKIKCYKDIRNLKNEIIRNKINL